MGIQQASDPISVRTDEVVVRKHLDTDRFPAPTIVFDITSERADTVMVRLVEGVPDGTDLADIGFHPDYGEQYWRIDDGDAVFEYELEGGSTQSTLFAIRTDESDVDPFLETEPALEVEPLGDGSDDVETGEAPEDADSATADRSDSTSLESQIPATETDGGGDGDETMVTDDTDDEIPELREEISSQTNGGAEASSTDDPVEEMPVQERAVTTGSGVDTTDAVKDDSDAAPTLETNTVIEDLLRQVRLGEVPEERLEELRDVLHPDEGSLDARVSRVQSDVADLQAYIDALESFLDEHGTGAQLVADFETRLAEVESELEANSHVVDEHAREIESIQSTTSDMREELDVLHDEMARANEAIQRIEAEMKEVDARVSDVDVRDEVESIDAELEALGERVSDVDVQDDIDSIRTEIDALQERVSEVDLREEIESIRSEFDSLEDQLSDADVSEELESMAADLDELDDRIDEIDARADIDHIEAEIEELSEWQTKLRSAFAEQTETESEGEAAAGD